MRSQKTGVRRIVACSIIVLVLCGFVSSAWVGIAAANSNPSQFNTDLSEKPDRHATVIGSDLNSLQQSDRIEVESSSNYNGMSNDGSQAIRMRVTLTATETTSGLTARFDETRNSFIDYSSFSVTVSGVDFNRTAPGTFNIERLDAGESITFTFDTYPRVLNQGTLEVVELSLDAQNPQTYDDEKVLSADMSNSPLLQTDTDDNGGGGSSLLPIGGIVIGIAGLLAAGYMRFVAVSKAKQAGTEKLENAFNDIENKVNDRASLQKIKEVKDEYL